MPTVSPLHCLRGVIVLLVVLACGDAGAPSETKPGPRILARIQSGTLHIETFDGPSRVASDVSVVARQYPAPGQSLPSSCPTQAAPEGPGSGKCATVTIRPGGGPYAEYSPVGTYQTDASGSVAVNVDHILAAIPNPQWKICLVAKPWVCTYMPNP